VHVRAVVVGARRWHRRFHYGAFHRLAHRAVHGLGRAGRPARELPDVGFFRAGSGVAPRVAGPRRGFFVALSGTEGVLLGLVAPWLLPVGVWWVVGI
jgi:hypothetical protein